MRNATSALILCVLLASGCKDTGANVNEVPGGELTAALTADATSVLVGTPIRFDAGDSTDDVGVAGRFSDSGIEVFRFDFGDGTVVDNDLFYIDHVYAEPGTYTTSVTVEDGADSATATLDVEVRFAPPTLLGVDTSADDKAVIGEWIVLEGRGFREANLPDVMFDLVDAPNVAFVTEFEIAVQVPPRVASGYVDMTIDFPYEDDADDVLEVWVTRYGLATDAWRGRVYIVEFGGGDSAEPRTQSMELDEASVVRMSGDGSYALIGDARYTATLAPTVVMADMTADFQPVVTAELPDVGDGPLHDIAIAAEAPVAVIMDLSGFTVLDTSDVANPQQVGDREVFGFSDMAPTACALSPDGLRLAVLSTFNDRVRFYDITPQGPVYSNDWVAVGEGTQDMVVHPDTGYLYVLGGGGEGALPPDLNLGNTTLTVIDFQGFTPENVHGGGVFMDANAAPLPLDLAVGPSGTAYVTSFDQNTGDILTAFGDIGSNPTDLGAWVDLIDSITSISVGAMQPFEGPLDGTLTAGTPLFAPFGFQTGVDVRYDEQVYVSVVIGLGTTLEFFNGNDILNLSLDIDYGVAVGNLATGDVQVFDMFTEPVVSYVDFVLNYDLAPITDLLLPPWALGDVAIQP